MLSDGPWNHCVAKTDLNSCGCMRVRVCVEQCGKFMYTVGTGGSVYVHCGHRWVSLCTLWAQVGEFMCTVGTGG